jgi:V/A-type H+/Na+-transporting ATPase subunit E
MKEGADRIISRIIDDADTKSKTIIAEANEKASLMQKEARDSAMRQAEKIIDQAHKEAVERKRRILGIAELEARKELLTAKQELIAEVFAKSLDELLAADDTTYLALLRKMLLENVKSGTETVAVSASDLKRIPAAFWKEVNERLIEKGKAGKIAPASEPRDIRGGFILLDERVEINCSFEALLAMKRDELEPEVASILFG